jgi:hypothetical protein
MGVGGRGLRKVALDRAAMQGFFADRPTDRRTKADDYGLKNSEKELRGTAKEGPCGQMHGATTALR